ncbi:hypothetical protein [Algirhabdus cladophorae]|uniref:hypothetical protein n=1 Tax=Algirhabdus cladophorae TaxID=3377108 RepID=UPI003B84866A
MLSSTLSTIQPSATVAMSDLARDLRAKWKDIIALAAGKADFDTPDHIRVAAKAAMDRGETR